MAETVLEHLDGKPTFTISTDERVWRNRLAKLAEQHPGECVCVAQNEDGSVMYRVPASWVRVRPPKVSTMTDEQKLAHAEQLKRWRESQVS